MVPLNGHTITFNCYLEQLADIFCKAQPLGMLLGRVASALENGHPWKLAFSALIWCVPEAARAVVQPADYSLSSCNKRKTMCVQGGGFSAAQFPDRMLKKPIHALFQRGAGKVRFSAPFIFNGLVPLKMAAHTRAANRCAEKQGFSTACLGPAS